MISLAETGAGEADELVCDGQEFPVWKMAAVRGQPPSHLPSLVGLPQLSGISHGPKAGLCSNIFFVKTLGW